jgi:hypothetical protein
MTRCRIQELFFSGVRTLANVIFWIRNFAVLYWISYAKFIMLQENGKREQRCSAQFLLLNHFTSMRKLIFIRVEMS